MIEPAPIEWPSLETVDDGVEFLGRLDEFCATPGHEGHACSTISTSRDLGRAGSAVAHGPASTWLATLMYFGRRP